MGHELANAARSRWRRLSCFITFVLHCGCTDLCCGSRLRDGRICEPKANSVGTADLLNAFYDGAHISLANAPGVLGAVYFLPILGVPLLLTHVQVTATKRSTPALAGSNSRSLTQPSAAHKPPPSGTGFFVVRLCQSWLLHTLLSPMRLPSSF
jgi:hypothetical protein